MGSVVLRVLGPMAAEVDGQPVELGGRRQRAVLACLVMQAGDVVGPGTLIDRLWPDDPPASATKLIQKYVSGLRSSLGSDSIETTGGGYRLAIELDDIDVVRFERSIHDVVSGHEHEPVWVGPPYSGCGELPFVVVERERLTRIRLEARLDQLAGRIEAGTFGPALAELERLAVEHLEHERVVTLLMRGLYASDRHVDALRAYRRHERHLREELGVDPSPELADLEGRILRHDASLRIARAAPARSDDAEAPPPHVTSDLIAPDDRSGGDAPVVEEIRPVVVVLAYEPSADIGPEDVRTRQREFATEVTGLAEPIGAHVERTVGDEVIALLGVPARDDDPERGASLGRAIVAARPSSKVAVVAGDAVVAVEPTVRLLAGTVLERARVLLGRTRRGRSTVDDGIEGIARPRDRTEAPVVGRDHELRLVDDVWRRVVDDGRLRIVDIIGDAGIGKSRLVSEACERFDPPPRDVIELGYSSSGSGILLARLREALLNLSRGHTEFEDWLATLDLSDPARQRLATRFRPLVEPTDATEPEGPDGWVRPFVQLCDALATRGPLVVIVEDVHWARPEMLGWMNDAVADLAGRPILTIVTRRREPPSTGLDATGIAERASVHLEPLPPPAVRELAETIGDDLEPASLHLATDRSGGNPLFLVHYVRMLRDRPDARDDVAPESVRLVITSRLDHLGAPLRTTIQAASFVPRRITAAVLAKMAGEEERTASEQLNALVRTGLLRRSRGDPTADDAIYEFQHALVSDVAYGQLTRVRRIELHRRAADVLTAAPDDSLDALQDVAWHWNQVVQLSDAEGLGLDDGVRAQARDAFALAGERLLHVDARLSVQHLRRALGLTTDATRERADLLLRLGAITTDAGEFDEAQRSLAEAAAIYDDVGHPAGAGEALARQARALWYLGRGDDIDRLLARSFERLALAPPSPSHAHAKVVVATQTALRGRPAEALEIVDQVEQVVQEHGTPEDVIRLLHARGHSRLDLDDAGGVGDLEESLRRTLDRGFGRLASQSYNNLAEVVWFARGPAEAVRLAHDGLDLAVDGGYLGQAPWHLAQICELSYDLGDWDAVLGAADTTLPLTPVVAWLLRDLGARVRFWRDDGDAIADLDEVLDAARITRELQVVIPMLSASIAAHAAVGDHDVTTSLGEELVSFADEHGHHPHREAGDAVRGLCRIGRVDLARDLIPARAPAVLRRRLMWETAQANIAEAEHRWEDAQAHHERAEAGWTAFPHPFEAAQAAAGRARVARRQGTTAACVDAIAARARDGFLRLGATRCAAEMSADR